MHARKSLLYEILGPSSAQGLGHQAMAMAMTAVRCVHHGEHRRQAQATFPRIPLIESVIKFCVYFFFSAPNNVRSILHRTTVTIILNNSYNIITLTFATLKQYI